MRRTTRGCAPKFAIQAHVVALWGRGFDCRAVAPQERRGRANACGAPTEPSVEHWVNGDICTGNVGASGRATCTHKSCHQIAVESGAQFVRRLAAKPTIW